MNYEQRYKNTLKRARIGLHDCNLLDCDDMTRRAVITTIYHLFPELTESDDERIRKGIIRNLQYLMDRSEGFVKEDLQERIDWLEKQCEPEDRGEISDGYHTFNELYRYRMLYNAAFFNLLPKHLVHKSKRHHDGEECFGGGWFIVMANLPTGQISNHYELKDWDLFQIPEKEIADEWDGHTPQEAAERLYKYLLEKQGEQTSDKVEPKFKVGDWVILNGVVAKILDKQKYGFIGLDIDGKDFFCNYGHTDSMRLWTINDAKNGDVLAYVTDEEDLWIMIYQSLYEPYEGHVHYHALLVNDNFSDKGTCCICIDNLKPATKEQQDLLFAKMKQAGYEWKQEEKKLIKINEPKFKIGDFITNGYCSGKVIGITDDAYLLDTGQGILFSCENTHLWTVNDAKDGDVLVSSSGKPFIFKGFFDNDPMAYGGLVADDSFWPASNSNWTTVYCKPATKEQRGILFQKMHEAGYEWDAEKKELKKIEPKTLDPDKVIEWIDEHVPTKFEEMQNYVNQFKKDFGI